MTVSTLTSRVVYIGNGSTTQFAVPFKVLDVDHLVVQRRVAATDAVEYSYVGTEFSYAGLGADAGTLTLHGTALGSAYELVIERTVPYTQELNLVNAGGFYPETVEEQLDLIVMQVQQVAAAPALLTSETLAQDATNATVAAYQATAASNAAVAAATRAQALALVRPNDQPAYKLAVPMGFVGDYVAINYGTTDTAHAVAKMVGGVLTETTINAFFALVATYDSTTWPEKTMLANSGLGMTIGTGAFNFTRPFAVYQRFYRAANVDNTSLYVANAANNARLSAATQAPGTDTGKMALSAVTSSATVNATGAGLDDANGTGEKTLWEVAYLFTADRMAICINGEEVRSFDTKTLNTSSLAALSLFTPAQFLPAQGSDMALAATVMGAVDADFGDLELRRFCSFTSPHIVDIATVQRFGEKSADTSYMPRQPVVQDVWMDRENVRWTVRYFVNAVDPAVTGTYPENPNEVRQRSFSMNKDSRVIQILGDSEVFEQTSGWPTAGGAISAPVELFTSFGTNRSLRAYVYDYPADGPLVQRTSTDGGRSPSARSAAVAFPTGVTVFTPAGNGKSVEVPVDAASNAGRHYFPVHGNLGMRLGYRDPNLSYGVTGVITGLPVGRFVSETNIALAPDNATLIMFSRVAASFGGADIQNERIISTMAIGGAAPAYVKTLNAGTGFQGVAAAAGLTQLDPEGLNGQLGALAFLRALSEAGAPFNHGGRLSVYGGTNYETLFEKNILSRWVVRRSFDIVGITEWGRTWFIGAWETSHDQSNGNSSIYTGMFNITDMALV
jgi:hypothetical protein